MNDSKEFLGKTLDAAIAEACAYYDVPREKLEIDIIEDAKTGIFGIVGARKAKIHARLATLPDFMQLGFSAPKPEREGRRNRKERQPRQPRREPVPREEKQEKGEKAERADDGDMESSLPRVPLAELDQDKLLEAVRTVIGNLVAPILDVQLEEVELSIEVGEDRVQVSVKSEDTGLLIGRDGQNLAAVQYLASRMITRAVGSQVRVQVDAGDYHVRQDTRLQELALSLAEKVKATGKVQTTRPLSAYQRRVIHLALQNDPDVQTRSSGEGALKHVVILKRKD